MDHSRHVSRVIRRSPQAVYGYAADLSHLQEWAAGVVAGSVTVLDDTRVRASSPMGEVLITFVARNSLGVLDHTVVLPDGSKTENPMRVVKHPDGAEVIFTLRHAGRPEADVAADAAAVAADLARLAELLDG
ncbi:SRPBCC family protein [Corynebacterium guangdongense]|uniref:Polyketide cyclase / dehydrase and lipid transport n=1 Tax=Corynebacterium guangdongense TaxID=1783348 RepID=A0ABU1ZW54_9CORY|nr:SRPBCC family protein [Corynebacterium guangdongense]MDR7329164.1 hypothetical protein [Corynebacterium guangdongense]WJZ17733.1 Polyketide cyclase / dehydrase and lipid transport [Corynebacterium guangdongense]